MARVSKTEVRSIIELDTSVVDDTALDLFIGAANTYVTALLGSSTLSTDQLKDIEMYISAHLASMKDKRVSEEKTGDASAKYEGKTAMGLKFTRYGQQAMFLDTTGTLAAASNGKKASLAVIEIDEVQ